MREGSHDSAACETARLVPRLAAPLVTAPSVANRWGCLYATGSANEAKAPAPEREPSTVGSVRICGLTAPLRHVCMFVATLETGAVGGGCWICEAEAADGGS